MFIIERLISSVAPFSCLGCGQEGEIVCKRCIPDFCPVVPSRCYRCRAVTDGFSVCQRCRPRTVLKRVWVRTELTGNPERLVHMFKFERAQALAPVIAAFMGELL